MMNRQLVANGDAWVGVTGKPISIDALKNFDPVRYGSLSMANPLPLSAREHSTSFTKQALQALR